MNHVRGWDTVVPPASLFEAGAPVDLFAIQRETLVEQANLPDRLGAYEHHRAKRMIDFKRLAGIIPPARVATIQPRLVEPGMDGEQVNVQLGQTREAKGAILKRAICVRESRGDDCGSGPRPDGS